jgi:hypothetical protein
MAQPDTQEPRDNYPPMLVIEVSIFSGRSMVMLWASGLI